MAVIKTFSVTKSWSGIYASGHFGYVQAQATGSSTSFRVNCYVYPDGTASGFFDMDISDLPSNAQIISCNVTSRFTVSAYSGITNKGITTPGISGSGGINQRILEYLQQHPGTQSINFGAYSQFQNNGLVYYTINEAPTPANMSAAEASYRNQDVYSYLNSVTVTLEVTYEEVANDATISFGVNNTWQKCNVYYGTGGEWVKCKALFGADGAWKETQ